LYFVFFIYFLFLLFYIIFLAKLRWLLQIFSVNLQFLEGTILFFDCAAAVDVGADCFVEILATYLRSNALGLVGPLRVLQSLASGSTEWSHIGSE
jgi:hypothetical protein